MKKSMLLSFVTAGAIIATSVGTYAAWDTLEISNVADVTIESPVTMSMPNFENFTTTRETGKLNGDSAPTYTQDVTFTVENVPDDAKQNYKLEVKPMVLVDGTETEATGIKAVAENKTPSDTSINGTHTYTVTVTPEDASVTAGTYDVKVTAKIVPNTPAA